MFGCNGEAQLTEVRVNGQTVTFTNGNTGPNNVFGDNYCIITGLPADGVVNEIAFCSTGSITNTQCNGMFLNGNTVNQLLVDNTGEDFDSMQDSLTDNYQTFQSNTPPLTGNRVMAGANLSFTSSSTTAVQSMPGTLEIPATGRWHMEFTYDAPGSYPMPGILRMPEEVNDGTWFGTSFTVVSSPPLVTLAPVMETSDLSPSASW